MSADRKEENLILNSLFDIEHCATGLGILLFEGKSMALRSWDRWHCSMVMRFYVVSIVYISILPCIVSDIPTMKTKLGQSKCL